MLPDGETGLSTRIMSSIYTGLSPAENGMMAVSKYGGKDTTRPERSTFIDQMVRDNWSVLAMGMPFSIPFRSVNPESILHGDALQDQQVVPEQMGNLVVTPAPEADMVSDHPDRVYASFRDQTRQYFTKFKEALRYVEPDVGFIGTRLVDSYCHFQHTETRDGQTYREHLIEVIAQFAQEIYDKIDGDVFFFSDHGQTELTDTFYVNKWLSENGYLDVKVDTDFIDDLQQYQQGEQHPIDTRIENQVTIGQPGVVVDHESSSVICSDPFDSCLTLLEDRDSFDEEQFRQDLMETGLYRSVDYKWEMYDEQAQYYDTVPDIIPDRDEGVFVSGNVHPEPIGMGYHRTGVHDRTACFGSTRELDLPDGQILPEDMYDIITNFVGFDGQPSPVEDEQVQQMTEEEALQAMQKINGVHDL